MLKRHPFLKTLLKIAAVIIISFGTFILSVVTLFLFVTLVAAISSLGSDDLESPLPKTYRSVYGEVGSENKLLSIPVSGVILGEKKTADPLSFLDIGISFGYNIKEQLTQAAEDESIKGIILEVNSPGGTIFGSRAIADGVTYYKEKTGKPVIAHISGLGASGGYYAVVSSDTVYADYGSTIGSIGVITGPFKYYDEVISEDSGAFIGGVVTQNGVETTYITAGESKDFGNPYRRLTDKERQVLQQGVNNEYDLFVSYVSSHRKISENLLREEIGALIYDNKTAQAYKLIDGTLNREAAYAALADRARIDGSDFIIIQEKTEPGFIEVLFQSRLPSKTPTSVCPLASTILVYYGSVTELCRN